MLGKRMSLVIFSLHGGSRFVSSAGVVREISSKTGLDRFSELVAIAWWDKPSFIGGEHFGDAVNVGGNNG